MWIFGGCQLGWIYVFAASVIDVLWVLGLKYSDDFLTWTGTVMALVISFYLIIKACAILPSVMVDAVFTGMGAAALALIGCLWLGADCNIGMGICISLIIFGVVGIQMSTGEKEKEGAR